LYEAALAAIEKGQRLTEVLGSDAGDERLDYDSIYQGASEWKVLPAFDHPNEAARCLVSGTGLTHTASAKNRDAMHAKTKASDAPLSDSMKMFQWGVEGGKPSSGAIGVQPEWFYKGDGQALRAHGEPLWVPPFAEDGGEEPEIAGLYLIAPDGTPHRVGFAVGNEFSDHIMEKRNYLYLAPSKLRAASIGPEAVIGEDIEGIHGTVSVERSGGVLWSAQVATGEANMCHSIENMEHHQFKYAEHRRPGDVHVHFFGADAFSFGAGVQMQDGDVMVVEWQGMGRSLRNPVAFATESLTLTRVAVL
jgi:hypothetical protein